MGLRIVQSELASGVETNIEIASAVRLGRTSDGLRRLDLTIDAAVVRLVNEERVPGSVAANIEARSDVALRTAKAYRQVAPSEAPYARDVVSALQTVDGTARRLPFLSELRAAKGVR